MTPIVRRRLGWAQDGYVRGRYIEPFHTSAMHRFNHLNRLPNPILRIGFSLLLCLWTWPRWCLCLWLSFRFRHSCSWLRDLGRHFSSRVAHCAATVLDAAGPGRAYAAAHTPAAARMARGTTHALNVALALLILTAPLADAHAAIIPSLVAEERVVRAVRPYRVPRARARAQAPKPYPFSTHPQPVMGCLHGTVCRS